MPCTAQCGLCFLLADTTGFPLPETFQDVRSISRCAALCRPVPAPRHQKPLLSLVPAGWEPRARGRQAGNTSSEDS